MHFWIDKRSSQLHQYGGGGRRGAGGSGGFYSQNFGTHRSTHHPPPSLGHHHPHRLRTRSSSTSNATAALSGSTGNTSTTNPSSCNNNIGHSLQSINNNHHSSSSASLINPSSGINSNGNSSSVNTIALQYPHQQPHQVQQQHHHISLGNATSTTTINCGGRLSAGRNNEGALTSQNNGRGSSNNTYFAHHLSNHSPSAVSGSGIMAISGSNGGGPMINTASLNPPMAIVAGDDGEGTMTSTTVLTFPPSSTAVVPPNPSNSINLQLISCVNINRDNRGGIDLLWRNPYHVPGSSISRCRAYSRDTPPSVLGSSSASSSRGTRGRRTSNSSSSGPGRSSLPGIAGTASSNLSQNTTHEQPEGLSDRSNRSEHTSFDRDTATPQRSLSLTSPEAGEQSSPRTSLGGRPSLENDPGWACTKRVGLTLCFLAFILLGTVGAKFMIQGPGVIDTSRTGKAEAAAYFLFTELIFVAFAMALFFLGVACLRKRTNDYLLRQFNQYILNSSATSGVAGGAMGGIPRQDAYDFVYYDGENPQAGGGTGSPLSHGHHHHFHHNLHHGGFHNYRHHRSNGSLMEEGDYEGGGDLTHSPSNFHGAGPIHYPAHYGSSSSRHGSRSKPPPYHIALYLPLPEGMGGGGEISPTGNQNSNEQDSSKSNLKNTDGTNDGIRFIDSSSAKDLSDAAGSNAVNSSDVINDNRDSTSRAQNDAEEGQDNRSETPPPPYEQL